MLSVWRALRREPLVYFLAAGAALFWLWSWQSTADADYRIEIDAPERERLAAQWQAQMGRVPTAAELAGLVEQFVREEIYYREALRMGLDRDDVIIRRRLAQKLTFLTEDIATATQPTQAALRAHYEANLPRYVSRERVSFQHRYFSAERHADAEARARDAVAALNAGRGPSYQPDPFMLQADFAKRTDNEVSALFGNQFAAHLFALDVDVWDGPVRSAYGWHAVHVSAREPARQLDLAEVAERVARDLAQSQREAANRQYYEALRARYEVVDR